MEKGLLFFTISIACVWLLLDEFFGNKKLSSIIEYVAPDVQSPIEKKIDEVVNGTHTLQEKVDEKKQIEKSDKDNVLKNMEIKLKGLDRVGET